MVSTILTSKPTYHFIGVGGIGMSGLAELLVRQGYRVSGSDLAEGAITRRLAGLGVRVYLGHRAENLGDADVVVHSTAVKEDNPELAAARARGLKVLRRGQIAGPAHGGSYPGGGYRHARQDLHHRHDRGGAPGRQSRPHGGGGLGVGRAGVQRRPGPGRRFRGRVRRVRRLLCAALPRDHHHHQPGQRAPGLLPGPGPRPRDVCGVFAAAAAGRQGHRLRRRPAPGPDPRRLPPGAGHLQPEAGESRFLCHRSDASGVGVPLSACGAGARPWGPSPCPWRGRITF